VQTKAGGDITLLAPGGQINVGLPGTAVANPLGLRGAVMYGQGNLSALAQGDFQVNSQKVFVVGQGDITVWSSNGNIDAGRGANTAISVPPLVPTRQADGSITFALPSTTVGSGIGILKPALGDAQGDIGLYAPNGEVLALDAQIRAPGRITLAADVVRGADNIVGSVVVGAPAVVPAVSLSLPSAPTSAGETQNAVSGATAGQRSEARERGSLLTVELLGLGAGADDACDDANADSPKEKRKKDKNGKCSP
jgi:filamentous hemagglutinin